MNYRDFTPEDFAKDESFQKWILDDDPAATEFWKNWMEGNPELQSQIEKAIKIIQLVQFKVEELPERESDQLWDNIRSKTAPVGSPKIATHPASRRHFLQKIAAVFIGLLMICGAWYFLSGQHLQTKKSTAYGETRSIILPDNSIVHLNGNSTLTYNDTWEKKEVREVWLKGEAFFSVNKIEGQETLKKKFIVHTDDLDIEVHGTKFNVKQRNENIQVVLNSGKVSVIARKAGKRITMLPGDLVKYIERESRFIKEKIDPEPYTSWRNNQLIFDDTPLRDIASMLEDNYGIKVKIRDRELAERKFTGTSPVDDIDVLLTKLSKIFTLKINKTEKSVVISKE